MSGAVEKLKETIRAAPEAVKDLTANVKIKDLQSHIVDVTKSSVTMTSDYGAKLADTDHWLKVVNPNDPNGQGPALLEDQFGREKLHRFDHERIPERVVHARGVGAHGYFKLYKPIPEYSMAGMLNDINRITPMFVRMSTVQGSRGSADTVRDVRGFALKFYTKEGNWDIVGNNIPVFFIQDSIKFPDFVHAVKPEPHNEIPQAQTAHNNFWDFVYLHSEASHMVMWAMSDRAIPRSFRMMQGFGVNTFTLLNAQGQRHFVKFVWTPELGVHSLVWDEALKLGGQDPDFHRKDLYEAIEAGSYPKWKFGIQVIPEGQEHEFDFDILDSTKIWPEDLVPTQYIGEFVLNRNVDEFFTETEQVAFCTSHVVPGVGFSDDPLLQGRNFSYFDTQITRLGINWEELPINRPACPVMNFNRDGAMKHRIHKGKVNYWPNRFSAIPPTPVSEGGYSDYMQKVAGVKARLNGPKFKEHFNQARLFYNSLSPIEQIHVQRAFAFELDHCDEPIVYERMCQRLYDINPSLAATVSKMVGGPLEPPESPKPPTVPTKTTLLKAKALSQLEFPAETPTIATRKVAILLADGFDDTPVKNFKIAITAAGAIPMIIAPRRNNIIPRGGSSEGGITADHHLEGARSTMFDAVLIPPGPQSIANLRSHGRAIHWIREAFGHLKAIGALGSDAVRFLGEALGGDVIGKVQISSMDGKVVSSYGIVTKSVYSGDEEQEWWQKWKIARDEISFVSAFFYEISLHRNWQRDLDGLPNLVAF
ncbi:catalase-domain-containing protein [Terfezia boudieri ATCC MYA-4762]|uniref:Catalase n=1 Tax=Terfezia boudieri ATCC MYA-4762 TaxID=1051890 RepID=A0A3N4LU72_9PEZI|nr:catalase-domain-containing protein [Terfezia boudieri ATCC MYA-4762]